MQTTLELLSSPEVCRLVGCTPRELDWWTRIGTIAPVREAHGSGSQRGWGMDQVRVVALARQLRALGAPSPTIRRALDNLAQRDDEIWQVPVIVMIDGNLASRLHPPSAGWLVDLAQLPGA